MNQRKAVQYTVRDVSVELDTRLRETAALEDVSLNHATLRALERGLGVDGTPLRYRSLRGLVGRASTPDIRAWNEVLGELDQVNTDDWK